MIGVSICCCFVCFVVRFVVKLCVLFGVSICCCYLLSYCVFFVMFGCCCCCWLLFLLVFIAGPLGLPSPKHTHPELVEHQPDAS